MSVRQSPCEIQVLPTGLLLVAQVLVPVLALFPILLTRCRCTNAHRLLLIHSQPQFNREAAHPQAIRPLQEDMGLRSPMVKVARRWLMVRVRVTDHRLKDTRLVQALNPLNLNPESDCHLGPLSPQARECECHRRSNQQLKDRSEDSE